MRRQKVAVIETGEIAPQNRRTTGSPEYRHKSRHCASTGAAINVQTRDGTDRAREKTHRTPVFAIIIRRSEHTLRNAVYHTTGIRETRLAVRKRGKRRRPSMPPHICEGQELKNLLPSGHRRRRMCISSQQNTRVRE